MSNLTERSAGEAKAIEACEPPPFEFGDFVMGGGRLVASSCLAHCCPPVKL